MTTKEQQETRLINGVQMFYEKTSGPHSSSMIVKEGFGVFKYTSDENDVIDHPDGAEFIYSQIIDGGKVTIQVERIG